MITSPLDACLQETAVTLVGMVLGMAFLRLAHGMQPLIWAAFWALTAVHVWANVRAMRCLRISSLNQARTQLLLRHYLRTVCPLECHQLKGALMPRLPGLCSAVLGEQLPSN